MDLNKNTGKYKFAKHTEKYKYEEEKLRKVKI